MGAPYLSEFAGGVHRPVSAKRGRRKAPDRRALMGRLWVTVLSLVVGREDFGWFVAP